MIMDITGLKRHCAERSENQANWAVQPAVRWCCRAPGTVSLLSGCLGMLRRIRSVDQLTSNNFSPLLTAMGNLSEAWNCNFDDLWTWYDAKLREPSRISSHAMSGAATVTVYALECGQLTLPESTFVTPADPSALITVPVLSFLVQHPSGTRLLFDLGLRHPFSLYSEKIQEHITKRQPASSQPDVVASLARGGLTPDDIDVVILSHVHWDHIGNPSAFPRSRFVVGPTSLSLLDGTLSSGPGSHSSFERGIIPLERTTELPPRSSETETVVIPGGTGARWTKFGMLEHTLDVFGDGSVRIVDAPGHVPGHINLLLRIAGGRFVYLAGDAAHDRRIYTGARAIAEWTDKHGDRCCIHTDKATALATLSQIRALEEGGVEDGGEQGSVQVIFAHDVEWMAKARAENLFLPNPVV
ncbi:Metallo-hydrolase/oxidoreductase [Auricularia subglabra TFB-10046 SS5]|nr:Metallo-hydrolase/oxidoreductase [Auricularia subglabra TFB-10046 SS5]